jgi:hypothetical protein
MTNPPLPGAAPISQPPAKRARPSLLRRWWDRFVGTIITPKRVKCPLCGSTKTYPVTGMLPWQDAANELAQGKWLTEQGLTGIPLPPASAVPQTMMPGFEESYDYTEEEHHRCSNCRALLPPQFWASFVGRNMAVAVTGAAEHGKTTWLLSMLNPPNNHTFEILRRTSNVIAGSYHYAEPYTIDLLEHGFRTSVPYTFLGSSVERDKQRTEIRTLDIRGEHFTPQYLPKTKNILKRHLQRTGVGALLVIDRFVPENPEPGCQSVQTAADLRSVGRTYDEISVILRDTIADLWKAVIWTFLDCARWSQEAETALQQSSLDDDLRRKLLDVASGPLPNPTNTSPDALSLVNPESIDALHGAFRGTATLNEVEGFITLMFRLQLLYALAAGQSQTTKYDFYQRGGKTTVAAIVRLAGTLYKRTDALRGTGVGGNAFEPGHSWDVLPCGRVGQQSVWSDLILIRAVDSVN